MRATEDALAGASKALRETIFAHDYWMDSVVESDLPGDAVEAMLRALDALSQALSAVEDLRS